MTYLLRFIFVFYFLQSPPPPDILTAFTSPISHFRNLPTLWLLLGRYDRSCPMSWLHPATEHWRQATCPPFTHHLLSVLQHFTAPVFTRGGRPQAESTSYCHRSKHHRSTSSLRPGTDGSVEFPQEPTPQVHIVSEAWHWWQRWVSTGANSTGPHRLWGLALMVVFRVHTALGYSLLQSYPPLSTCSLQERTEF